MESVLAWVYVQLTRVDIGRPKFDLFLLAVMLRDGKAERGFPADGLVAARDQVSNQHKPILTHKDRILSRLLL